MNALEPLSEKSWIRIGGNGVVLRPASIDAFLECYGKGPVIGEGSNVLFRPTTRRIVSTEHLVGVSLVGPDRIKAQCGTPNRKLLQFAMQHGLGGIEYLATVPGSAGGAVFMNAGRGEKHGRSFGQHVVEVEVFDGTTLRTLSQKECCFGYRKSTFHHNPNWMIVNVTLTLSRQEPKDIQELVQNRMAYCSSHQDRGAPNLGTVFSTGYRHHPSFEGMVFGGIQWSRKTPNWMLNIGGGTYEDCLSMFKEIRRQHAEDLELEIRIL